MWGEDMECVKHNVQMECIRIAVLWTRLSGYFTSCLRMLKKRYDMELFVAHWPSRPNAPFDYREFSWIDALELKAGSSTARKISEQIEKFHPHILLVSGWMDKDYLRIAKEEKKRGALVVACFDNQWRNTIRQRLACIVAPINLQRTFTCVWVPGERAAQFGKKLGFTGSRLWRGLYSCDWSLFAECFHSRLAKVKDSQQWPGCFLFIGQYIERKGIGELVAAYKEYRKSVADPWELWCVGDGPLKTMLQDTPGIVNFGFVQPSELPAIYERAGAFVLPSRFDAWALVIHEATSAGLPILCSGECGSSVELVQDGYNGYILNAGDKDNLCKRLFQLSNKITDELVVMSQRSHALSERYTPEGWADYLIENYLAFCN